MVRICLLWLTRQYPNIVKWLKAARVAALKERGDKFFSNRLYTDAVLYWASTVAAF